jgi:integrase
VPAGATITGEGAQRTARWKTRQGKTAAAPVVILGDGRDAIRQESSTYFAKYRDGDGTVRVVPTKCRDESTARQFLRELERTADRVRAGVVTTQELAVADMMSDPIGRHIADYVATLTGSASHRENTERYLQRLAADCRWNRLSDLRRDDLELWLADQARQNRSARSRNAHHVAATSFANWCVRSKRMTINPFARLPKADVELDRRRCRRSLSPDEVERIAEAAEMAPGRPPTKQGTAGGRPAQRLTAADRGLLWRFLAGTGLRLNEARLLTVGDMTLDGAQPGITLPARITKGKRSDYVPLHPTLAAMLRRFVQGRKSSDSVFSIPSDVLKRFKGDCKRAGVPLVDERGRTIDIHALRMSFIDRLAKSGVPPRITQELARHADITTTMRHYTDIRVHDLHAAIASVAPSVAPTPVNSGATESAPDVSRRSGQ